jgi:surface polysaccharide O-acyltransferase-like enzyme
MKMSRQIPLLTVCFIEGASLMAWELLSVKLAAPYYGATIYMWASALGITLTGIASGYFLGGRWSRSPQAPRTLLFVLFASSLYSFVLPFIAKGAMDATVHSMGMISGPLLSMLVFLPLILLFGAVSPLLIQQLVKSSVEPGRAGGWVYGVSTVGGIVGTLFTGLFSIRYFGVMQTCIVFAALMLVAALIYLARYKKKETGD